MPIIKHNKLIETSYKLNSREQFFVLYLISQISQGGGEFREYRMHYSEIEKIINFDGKRRIANKSEVFTLMDKLNSEPIIYEKGSIIGKSVWLQHMEHNTETDEFIFSLSERLREYLLQLKEHFTRYNISNIVYLNANAVRLYEVLKRYQFKGECELSIEKIKFFLGIDNRYPKFYEFKRWVLIPSQKEIKKYTDIRFDFEPAKKDRKRIVSLKFYIYENEPSFTPESLRLLSKIEGKPSGSDPNSPDLFSSANQIKGKDPSFSNSQNQAFDFLAEKGINKTFIRDQILNHPKVKYMPLQGYEDLYTRFLWKFFSDKSNSDKPAGAFVSWWKKGRLTEDGLHARMVEMVIKRKKSMSQEERDQRENAQKQKPPEEKKKEKITFRMGNLTFNIEQFKAEYPDQYQSILKKVRQDYEDAFQSLDQQFDADKYRKAIEDKVYHYCLEWFQNQSSKLQ